MKIVTAPHESYGVEHRHNMKIFLAGGITGCPDWQSDLIVSITAFRDSIDCKNDITLYNPRRATFDVSDPNASEVQVAWEFDKLEKSGLIIFWFSNATINPIVLYELGMWGNSRNKQIVIGVEEGYTRIQDVELQTKLARPDVKILYSFTDFIKEIRLLVGRHLYK